MGGAGQLGFAVGAHVATASSAHSTLHPRPLLQEAAKQLKGVPLPASLSAHIYNLQ